MLAKEILMKSRLLLLFTVLLFTACAPQAAATPVGPSAPGATPTQVEPITLRMAVADQEGRPSDPYVHEFINQVKTLSNGNIDVKPTWDAGAETTPSFEQGVVTVVKAGEYDLGLAGSRAWDGLGVTTFQALQAPFLIDNDALSEAVASSDIATRMLDRLSPAGMAGLALWPEDLRHPFSMNLDQPILLPKDLEGLSVRAIPSEVSYMLIDALGGNPMYGDDYQAAESGLRQGASLSGAPSATGNVIFFPKFQVLFANGAAFEKLSEGQRAILLAAAASTQKKAIADHPSEADAAAAWCADGGTVVMATAEQVAAFEAAAQPVFDKIEQDPLNAEMIAAIRELKANTTPAPGAQACGSDLAQSSALPTSESAVWSTGLPPNGTWQAEVTSDVFVRMGLLRSAATEWAGTYTITFNDGKYLGVWQGEPGQSGKCQANYELVGDLVRLTYYQTTGDECVNEIDDIQWRLDQDGLHLHVVDIKNAPVTEIKAYYEAKPWEQVDVWSTGVPPNGTWTVTLTAEDVIAKGIRPSKANEWAGQFFFEFQDGQGLFRGEYLDGFIGECPFTYEAVEDFFRNTYIDSGQPNYDCGTTLDDLQWRLDEAGQLYIHVIDIKRGLLLENKAIYEAKPWQKVE
jgi:TRAP-type C4-dicarboxylate transport system substrate-binding protein